MLHTFIGADEDEVRETVREPMKEYLRSSVDLIKQAAWTFPTFVQRGGEQGKSPVEIMDSQPLSPKTTWTPCWNTHSRATTAPARLFGTPQRCLALVDKFKGAGVDEIACLIDFGIATDTVLDAFEASESTDGRSPAIARRRCSALSVAEQIAQQRGHAPAMHALHGFDAGRGCGGPRRACRACRR